MSFRDALTPLNIGLVLLLVAATVAGFALVPAGTSLPVHWGISGEADRYLPRDAALLMPAGIAVLTLAILFGAQRLAGEARRQAAKYAIAAVIPGLLALLLAVQAGTVMIGMGIAVDMVRVVVLGLGLLLVLIGNVMPKTQPNWVAGIRVPWTLADAANWQATHRLGGLLMMIGGAAIVVAALLTGQPTVLLAVTGFAIVLPLVVAIVYSYRLARRG
jgi:uncharacterized membrane protein